MSDPQDALEHLARTQAPSLLAYFARRVPTHSDAEDLLSETFVALASRPARIPHHERGARMWAFGVARHVLLAHRRKAGTQDVAMDDWFIESLSPVQEPHEPEHREVREAIIELTPRQREIVMLVHWEGFTLTEAAHHLGMRPSTARTHYDRAKDTLRFLLDDEATPTALQRGGTGRTR